jgi:hypothetical protein
MDGDTAESTADSANRCETHWVEISERAAQNARLPRHHSSFAVTLEPTIPRQRWIVEFASESWRLWVNLRSLGPHGLTASSRHSQLVFMIRSPPLCESLWIYSTSRSNSLIFLVEASALKGFVSVWCFWYIPLGML